MSNQQVGTERTTVDPERLNQFLGKFVGDLGATLHAPTVIVGEKLGLYKAMAGATIAHGGLGLCLLGLLIAGLLCYAFYYRVPAMLGMQTGYPLYVVGSSTFGTAGGYVFPYDVSTLAELDAAADGGLGEEPRR